MLGAPKLLRAARVFVPLATVATLAACFRTEVLVQKFNEGVVETGTGDPKHSYASLRKETAYRRIYPELIDGYFGEGGPDVPIVKELRKQANDECWFSCRVGNWLCHEGKQGRVRCCDPGRDGAACKEGELHPAVLPGCACDGSAPPPDDQLQAQQTLADQVAAHVPLPETQQPLCKAPGTPESTALEQFVDTVRLRGALQRAIEGSAALIDEGQLPLRELHEVARTAFNAAADYHQNRKWKRQLAQPTLGLVVKGGASTGIFSAGVVWAVLNVINQCEQTGLCDARGVHPRFTILSGTSTGSLVASAVDIYNAATCAKQRQERLNLFEQWFVCMPSKELYCVEEADIRDLIDKKQLSLLQLDGLRNQLDAHLSQETLDNPSELILSEVDFRTGRLDAISDQDPSQVKRPADVASAAVASSAFPVVVRPEPHLPIDHDGGGKFAYLDGGARSELPIGAAVRRGAERVLIVSSGPSVIAESPEIGNGLDVLVRVIDVTVGGAHESEIAWAPKLAQSLRLSELTECQFQLTRSEQAKYLCPESVCNAEAVCRGDWPNACRPPPPEAAQDGQPSRPPPTADLIRPLWQTTSIYRDERLVQGLPGYVFRNTDQRKLFLAGAEEVRQRCLEIGKLLGVLRGDATDAAVRSQLLTWCAPSLQDLCRGKKPDESMRPCSTPPSVPTRLSPCP